MADPLPLDHATPELDDSAFLEHAYLTYIIPSSTNSNIGEVVKAAIAENKPLEELESRTWLFFGMVAFALPRPRSSSSHSTHF